MNNDKYRAPAVIIHWLMALAIIIMIGMGIYMVDLPKGSDERSWFFSLHKSIGLTLALLVLLRVCWRVYAGAPAMPNFIDSQKRKLAAATHHMLYLLMVLQPLSGYLSSSFSGYKTRFWGIPLYNWGWKSPELNEFFTLIHDISAYSLIALIIVHFAGVVYHIKQREYQIIRRMWF